MRKLMRKLSGPKSYFRSPSRENKFPYRKWQLKVLVWLPSNHKWLFLNDWKWHFNKSANLDYIRDLLSAGQLPKVYKSKIVGFEISKNFFVGIEGPIVIADYDLLRRLFSNENISSRLDNKSLCLEEKLIRSDYQLDKTATNIFRIWFQPIRIRRQIWKNWRRSNGFFEIEPIRGANGLRDGTVSETVHMIGHIVFSEQNGVKFIMLEARLPKSVKNTFIVRTKKFFSSVKPKKRQNWAKWLFKIQCNLSMSSNLRWKPIQTVSS